MQSVCSKQYVTIVTHAATRFRLYGGMAEHVLSRSNPCTAPVTAHYSQSALPVPARSAAGWVLGGPPPVPHRCVHVSGAQCPWPLANAPHPRQGPPTCSSTTDAARSLRHMYTGSVHCTVSSPVPPGGHATMLTALHRSGGENLGEPGRTLAVYGNTD